jgi:hypothetical protein
MKNHIVQPGECLSSIADRYGFGRWETIYQDGANADLRRKRPDPHVLHPGDVVVIPDLAQRTVQAPTDKRHTFVLKSLRRKLRIQLIDDEGNQLATLPFTADDGFRLHAGHTDGDGWLTLDLPVDSTRVEVDVGGWVRVFEPGQLNPIRPDTSDEGTSGAQARLAGLGFDPGPIDGVLGPRTRAAVVAFQRSFGLELSGKVDDPTRAKLQELFAS